MFRRISIHIALVFLFAYAQICAVTHEISHFEDLVKHNQAKHNQQDQNTHSEQCEKCISFAKIAGGLVTQGFVLPTLQVSFIASTPLSTQLLSQPHTAYAARAPPLTTLI